ncbi:MAG: sulfite exporter TauE/SafE family protein [Alphaproteobacteria bacterium]|nr:sulfite exporter TauE/SafE family protein [Alphaproteobacteria bacterium]
MPTDPVFYIVASLAVILVGIAKGGFAGLGAAAMPILVLVMDPAPAAAMLLPILIAQDVVSVWAFRHEFDWPTLKLMVPGGLVGVFLGWLFSTAVPVDAVRGLVGLISVVFGLYRLAVGRGVQLQFRQKMPNWLGTFWGAVSGFTSQVAHAGGPPFQIWALSRNFPHTIFIGTSAIFFAVLNWMKVPAYFALGQFTAANMRLTLVFMPLAIASTFAGVWLVRRLSAARFNSLIALLMVGVGAELLRQSLS